MQALTLEQLFGVNAIQTSQSLTITKADLPFLTPSSNNTAESLLAAIVLKVLENFRFAITNENSQYITDENGQFIEFDNGDFIPSLYVFRWDSIIAQRDENYYIRDTIVIQDYTLQS